MRVDLKVAVAGERQREATVRRDIEALQRLQNNDGGFAFWVRGHESWPYISIHVAHALVRAKTKGYAVPESMLAKSKAYLQSIEEENFTKLPAAVYVLINDIPIELIGQRMSYALDSFPLVAVPIFIFVGNFMNQAGITERIFRFAATLVGRVPGGLAQVNIVASLIFSGMSGAALADVGGLGRIEVKAMTSHGFSRAFAGAVHAGDEEHLVGDLLQGLEELRGIARMNEHREFQSPSLAKLFYRG